MDFEHTVAVIAAVVSALSAVAAMIAAWLAHQSDKQVAHANRDAARRERDNRVRELSQIANEVVAATVRVDDLANQLKLAYQTSFALAGQRPRSSRLQMFTAGIEEKQHAIGPMQTAARDTIENGGTLTDEEVMTRLVELEGYLAHLDRVGEKFHVDLARVESGNERKRHSERKIIGPDAN